MDLSKDWDLQKYFFQWNTPEQWVHYIKNRLNSKHEYELIPKIYKSIQHKCIGFQLHFYQYVQGQQYFLGSLYVGSDYLEAVIFHLNIILLFQKMDPPFIIKKI